MDNELIPVIIQEVTSSNQSRIDELLEAFIADQDVKESSKGLYSQRSSKNTKFMFIS